jgi:RelA/SpoT family (p)ppGpp synthetase
MGYKSELLQAIKKNNLKVDEDKILLAYEFAKESHIGQFRKSGEEYIVHPIEVAKILIDMRVDTDTIVAGILHDVIEDTYITKADIQYNFGEGVADLVDGVTKLSILPEGTTKQHENIRKMIVAMAKDVRVVIIKLADRLHNMRTLKYMKAEKQKKIALETLEIFAPLAHRLGMAKIKWELEDLALYYLEPEIYKEIVRLVSTKRTERESYTNEVIELLKDELKKQNVKGDISGRPKHFYSIYKKMFEKGKTFEELYDLIAIRVIVENESDCYHVLGILHNFWTPVPGRFKDYIAVPKSNGYQSIHTTVVGPLGKFLEIQIRTEEMHDIAEEGVAAHWTYKEKKTSAKADHVYSWLRKILEWQQEADNSEEFIETVTGDILSETVFVFSPKGDVIELMAGATPLDFAFYIHTQIGYKCIGAKVNDKIVPIDYKLKNGDRVEIITSKAAKGPGNDWLNIVVTHGAKSKIRKWLKDQKYEESVKIGKEMMEKELSKSNISYKDFEQNEIILDYIKKHHLPTVTELLFQVAEGRLKAENIVAKIKPSEKKDLKLEDMIGSKTTSKKKKNDYGIVVEGVDNTLIRFAKCCTPLPGDDIGGYITRGSGIAVHRNDCLNYQNMIQNDPDRQIEVNWDESVIEKKVNKYAFTFSVIVYDRPNVLMELVTLVAEHKINIVGVNSSIINSTTSKERCINIKFTIEISDKESYNRLISHMSKLKDVVEIKR